jgi:hypothetical protein
MLAIAAPAAAHDYWLELSSYRPKVGERVEVRHRVGEHWTGEPAPRYPAAIVRFEAIGPDGPGGPVQPIRGAPGADPAGAFLLLRPGSQQVVYQGHNRNFLELDAARFEEYLRQEGLEWALAERAQRGETGARSREVFSRSAKAWLCAPPLGEAPATPAPAGSLTLDIVPDRDPCRLRVGDEIGVQVLFRGAPRAELLVYALHAEAAGAPAQARTGKDGGVRLRLDRAGRWMIKTVHLERVDQPGWEWESFWSSFTLELQP